MADFIGEANFLRGVMTGRSGDHAVMEVEGQTVAVAARDALEQGKEYDHRPAARGRPCWPTTGAYALQAWCCPALWAPTRTTTCMLGNTLVKLSETNPQNKYIYAVGDECRLVFAPDAVHVL